MVPISTFINELCDQTCIVQKGEHPFVRHTSYVRYRNATCITCQAVEKGLAEGQFTAHADMNSQTFLRVRNGICRSPYTPRKIRTYMGCP